MIQRGDVCWADLDPPSGSEPGYRRPVIVVQSDAFNSSRIQSVIVIALTSTLRFADAPGNVLIPKSASGLPKDSVANVSQVLTLDRAILAERTRRLPAPLMAAIERGLRLVLDL